MWSHVRWAAAVLAAVSLVMAGCGGTEDEPAADETAAEETAAVPEVVSMLVTADDLDGEWTVNLYPDAPVQLSESGVVTEEMLEMIPRIELCESASAEAQAAVEGLRWQAFRQLDLTVDDPVDTTADAVSGRIIGVNEALLAGDPAEVEATFEALTSGLESCGWSTTADEDGHTSTAEPWEAVPEVGDDRVGVLTTIEEPGGGGGFVIYEVLVRDGSVLMKEMVAEAFIGEGVTPQLTADQAAAIVTTTAARIS